jgi:hypothetical protein
MFRQDTVARDTADLYQEPVVVNEIEHTLIDALKMVIATQEKTIESLEKQLAALGLESRNLKEDRK